MLHKIIILTLIVILTCGKFPFPKKIWLYWDSNIQQAPISILLCYNKLKSVAETQSFTLTLLSQQNLAQHLERYDEFLEIKSNAKTPWKQNIADLVRLMILEQEGGIYLDISSVLIYGLKWLQEIQDFEYLLANVQEGVQPDLLVPYIHFYQSTSGQRGYKGTILNEQPGFQVWFIAAKPKTPAITQWLKWYSHFYQMNLSQKVPIYTQEDIYFRNIEGSQYLNANKAIYYFLQRKQLQLDKNITLFSSRTLAVNHYKIWGFKGEYGPFVFYLRLVPEQSYLFTKTVNELSQQFVRLHFYIKLTQSDRLYIQQMLEYQSSQVIEKKIGFQEFLESSPKLKHCREMVFPYEGSIVANLLADNQVAQQKKYLILSKIEVHQWEKYCENLLNEEKQNALKNLFEAFKQVVGSINGEPISASIAKPYETELYEKNGLGLFDYLIIWLKNNIFGLKIFMHYSIGLLLIGLTFKIMNKYLSNYSLMLSLFSIPNDKMQKVSKPRKQLRGFSLILVYLLFATNTFIIAMFHLFQRIGDVHEQYLLLKVILWRYVLLILIEERVHQKNQVWFRIRLDEYMMTINVVIEFCLTKMVLFNIQKRQNMLGSHAILIGMMCPYILKLYNKLSSSSSTQYPSLTNDQKKNKPETQFHESIQTYTPIITIIFLLFCLITNLKHMTYGQHYFIRSLIYPIVIFAIFVTIKLIIKLWIRKTSQKDNRSSVIRGNNEYVKYDKIIITLSIALMSWFCYNYYYNFNEWSLDWGNAYGVDKFLVNYFIVISINLLKPINEHLYLQSTKSQLFMFIIRTLLPFVFPLLLNIQFKVDHLGILGGFQKWMPYTVFVMILNRLSQRKQEMVNRDIQNINSEQQLEVINSQRVSDNFIV